MVMMHSFSQYLNSAEHAHDQEPHGTDELERRKSGDGPQDDGHVDGTLRGVVGIGLKALQAPCAEDDGHEAEVAHDPEEYDARTEALVIILLLLARRRDSLLDGCFDHNLPHLSLVLGIEIRVVRRDVDVYLATRLEVGGRQLLSFVITFCTPCNIMGITEGVDVENVDVSRGEE